MLYQLYLVTVLVACVDSVVSAQNFSLYAYGTGITSGLQLFYGDGQSSVASQDERLTIPKGQAYVGTSAPSFLSQAVNITRTLTCRLRRWISNYNSLQERRRHGVRSLAERNGGLDFSTDHVRRYHGRRHECGRLRRG